jgi:uncharacterized protein
MATSWERAMLAWPNGERCQRSLETLGTARRLRRWRDAPERCVNCARRAIVVCGGQAFCGGCRSQRESRMMTARAVGPAETRAADGIHKSGGSDGFLAGHAGLLTGYAIVFDSLSVDLNGFRERIRPSAVDRTIREASDLRGLWNHDPGIALGRVKARTLTVAKDSRGLRARIATPSWAAGHVESVARGDIGGMSFAFQMIDDEWSVDSRGMPIREVLDATLSEISVVNFPAYQATTISAGPEPPGRSVDFARRQLKTLLAR